MDSLIPENDFDGLIEFEDKTFKSMLESSPLHGGHRRNVCFTKICCSATCSLPETISMVALCFPGEENVASSLRMMAFLNTYVALLFSSGEVELFKQCVTTR
jgi:hypothetical protein